MKISDWVTKRNRKMDHGESKREILRRRQSAKALTKACQGVREAVTGPLTEAGVEGKVLQNAA